MGTTGRFVCLLFVAAIALGCGVDPASGAGESCEQASDCTTGLTCLGGVCQKPAATTAASFTFDTTETGGSFQCQLDAGGRAHVSYYDVLNGDLRYATKPSGGSWSASAIDTFGTVGQFGHVGVDSNKKPHVTYYDASMRALRHATNSH